MTIKELKSLQKKGGTTKAYGIRQLSTWNWLSDCETTSFACFAKRFESKKKAYEHAKKIFGLAKRDTELWELEDTDYNGNSITKYKKVEICGVLLTSKEEWLTEEIEEARLMHTAINKGE